MMRMPPDCQGRKERQDHVWCEKFGYFIDSRSLFVAVLSENSLPPPFCVPPTDFCPLDLILPYFLPPRREPKTPRMICRPTDEPMDRATLLAAACTIPSL
ncbi:MAG: hypothetical protein MZV70_59985 [Desulfobacterales bacterium]|nr:hypothetical protein [Desulfobacterales bacterium]